MRARARTGWIIVVLVAAGIILAGGSLMIYRIFFQSAMIEAGPFSGRYGSNGERIYFTGTSRSGPPISARMQGMHRMPPSMLSCAACHGDDGRGRRVGMMMDTFETPDIRWDHLTEAEHEEEGEEHPPYDEDSIREAITLGVDPAGHSLDMRMPRWDMTEAQLDDLIVFLKTLD